MKKLTLFLFLAGGFLGYSGSAQVNVSINIGSQPLWGPAGYDEVQYYYFPEYDVYYDVPHRQYIYWNNERMVTGRMLPSRYHADLYRTYKVVRNEPRPWRRHNDDRQKYNEYKGRHDQVVIRDSHDEKYWQVKGHPDHGKWKGNGNGNGKGNGNGNGKGNGRGRGHHS